MFRIGETPARGWGIESNTEAQVSGGGYGGFATKAICDFARHIVCAVMSAEQRHDAGAIFGHGNHGRVSLLVLDFGRECADEDSARTDADDWTRPPEHLRDVRGGFLKRDITRTDTFRQPVNFGAR